MHTRMRQTLSMEMFQAFSSKKRIYFNKQEYILLVFNRDTEKLAYVIKDLQECMISCVCVIYHKKNQLIQL